MRLHIISYEAGPSVQAEQETYKELATFEAWPPRVPVRTEIITVAGTPYEVKGVFWDVTSYPNDRHEITSVTVYVLQRLK